MSRWSRKAVIVLIGIAYSVALVGCSNDGNDLTSTINGNVGEVIAAFNSGEERTSESRLATLKEFFSLVRLAHAQALGLEDITVEAVSDGQVVDSTQTDAVGDFSLTVSPGTFMLNFEVDGVVAQLELIVPEQTVVTLGVSIDVSEQVVEVEQLDYVVQDAIRCTSEDVTIADAGELKIEGEGGSCIAVAGKCKMQIDSKSVLLTGCGRCIDASGSGNVLITVRDGVECSATEVGLLARGNTTVSIMSLGSDAAADAAVVSPSVALNVEGDDMVDEPDAGGDIEIVAPAAIDLAGNPEVSLTGARIKFESANNVVEATGNSFLSMQALRQESLASFAAALTTKVEDVNSEEGDTGDDGTIHLTSTSSSTVVTQGQADVRLNAERNVQFAALGSAVDSGGSSNVEIDSGTGASDGAENLAENFMQGDADIRSDNAFGVAASGSSNVFIRANGVCTVVGASGDVSDNSTGTVSVCE